MKFNNLEKLIRDSIQESIDLDIDIKFYVRKPQQFKDNVIKTLKRRIKKQKEEVIKNESE